MTNEDKTNLLLENFRKGDSFAFDKLVSLYEKSVYRLCHRFFNNEEDALDATQEVFIKIYKNLERFEGRSSFSTWLYRIAANSCITLSEKKKKEKEGVLKTMVQWWNHWTQPTPEEVVIDRELSLLNKKVVNKALAKLPEIYRLPLILKDMEDMPMDKIGEVLEVPIGTVKSRLNRGRGMLHEKLELYLRENKL